MGGSKIDSVAIEKEFSVENNSVPMILIKDLSNSASEYLLEIDKAEKRILFNSEDVGKNTIGQECILVAKVGNKLKPTLNDGTRRISVSSNVLALFVERNTILPEYFIFQLNKEYVTKQLDSIRRGSAQKYFTLKDFLNVSIEIDTIENQEKTLNEFYKNELKESAFLIKDEIRKSEELETKILSALQHELRAQILHPLGQEISILKSFLDRKQEVESKPFSWDDSISLMPNSRKVKEVFTHFDKVIGTASKLVDNIQSIIELDRDKLKKKRVNMQDFIKSCVDDFGDTASDTDSDLKQRTFDT